MCFFIKKKKKYSTRVNYFIRGNLAFVSVAHLGRQLILPKLYSVTNSIQDQNVNESTTLIVQLL